MRRVDGTDWCCTVADVAHAALVEVGRPDLAEGFGVWLDEDGTPYLEPFDQLNAADFQLMIRAETLALDAPVRSRTTASTVRIN